LSAQKVEYSFPNFISSLHTRQKITKRFLGYPCERLVWEGDCLATTTVMDYIRVIQIQQNPDPVEKAGHFRSRSGAFRGARGLWRLGISFRTNRDAHTSTKGNQMTPPRLALRAIWLSLLAKATAQSRAQLSSW
jgi:hypothetical protein